MIRPRIWPSIAGLAVLAATACGQGPAVQLPTYSYFFVDTTVSVPVGGIASLGGVSGAASLANQFAAPPLLLANRATTTRRSAAGVQVTATVHDFEAMDRELLSRPTASYPNGLTHAAPAPAQATPSIASPADRPAASVAELRARRQKETEARRRQAKSFYDRGLAAEAAGKAAVARIYYQMAARRAEGPLEAEISARLDQLGSAGPAGKIAQGRP